MFVTIAAVSFDTTEQFMRELRLINITEFLGDNVTECCLNIKSLFEHLEVSGYWDHHLLVGIARFFKGGSEEHFILW